VETTTAEGEEEEEEKARQAEAGGVVTSAYPVLAPIFGPQTKDEMIDEW
jgi:hypothetical protein